MIPQIPMNICITVTTWIKLEATKIFHWCWQKVGVQYWQSSVQTAEAGYSANIREKVHKYSVSQNLIDYFRHFEAQARQKLLYGVLTQSALLIWYVSMRQTEEIGNIQKILKNILFLDHSLKISFSRLDSLCRAKLPSVSYLSPTLSKYW